MSAYPYPFPPPHPQAGYQLSYNAIQLSDDQQREQQRKRTYLSLLPPAQIIEICLNFEQCVPLHIRSTVWPADLDAAILALQKSSQPDTAQVDPVLQQQSPPPPTESACTPVSGGSANVASQQVHPPGGEQGFMPPVQASEASYPTPSNSTEKPTSPSPIPPSAITHNTEQPPTPSAPPQLPAQPTAEFSNIETSPAPADTPSLPQTQPLAAAQPPTPVPQTTQPLTQAHEPTPQLALQTPIAQAPGHPQPASQVGTAALPAAYPYAPYGYAVQQPYVAAGSMPQAAYTHTPYYQPPSTTATGYPTHYPGYPSYAPPQHPYQSSTHQHTTQQPPPPPPPQGEDLPSYEDMIVEALTEIGDPDGAAPKDIFTWIGTRWPLQTNFRPSASQALQKAFKRGRLEKEKSGRYRLNPTWEGGATSRRTTRRPQTLAQTTYALHHPPQQAVSPFTHAPLPHRAHTTPPPPAHPPQHQPYAGYAYPYPGYAGYPGYPFGTQPTAGGNTSKSMTSVFKTTLASKTTASKTISSSKEKENTADETGDAWEAAQHILQAINFGSLQTQLASTSSTASGSSVAPPAMAGLDLKMDSSSSAPNASTSGVALGEDGLGSATLTDEERASLQAQLALLAAQLSEIANGEDEDDEDDVEDIAPAPPVQRQDSPSPVPQLQYPQQNVSVPAPVAPQPPVQPIHSVLVDVNQFPEEASQSVVVQQSGTTVPSVETNGPRHDVPAIPSPQPELVSLDPEEEDEEDDDMEMVDVDSFMQSLQA